jgi:hypothetical protein
MKDQRSAGTLIQICTELLLLLLLPPCRVVGGSGSFCIIESMQQVLVDIRIYLVSRQSNGTILHYCSVLQYKRGIFQSCTCWHVSCM